jgi:hypothetical protein
MISSTSPYPLQAATVSAVPHSGLAAQTLDRRPLRFALDRDVSNEEDRRAEELFDEELRKFEDHVLGTSTARDNFCDNY